MKSSRTDKGQVLPGLPEKPSKAKPEKRQPIRPRPGRKGNRYPAEIFENP